MAAAAVLAAVHNSTQPHHHPTRIPFYYAFKLAFLVYLGYPGWNGATIIYNNFLKARLFFSLLLID